MTWTSEELKLSCGSVATGAFLVEGDSAFDPSGLARPQGEEQNNSPGQWSFGPALAWYTDISTEEPIRWSIAGASYSRLDRIFCRVPECALLNSTVAARVSIDTLKRRAGLDSDHVPTWVKVTKKTKLHNVSRPIPP